MENTNPSPAAGAKTPGPGGNIPIDVIVVLQILSRTKKEYNQRKISRCPYVVQAQIELAGEAPRRRWVYTRDAHESGIGFITQEVLPEGAAGTIHLPVHGERLSIPCTLQRFRRTFGEWYEGAATLARQEPRLAWAALTGGKPAT